jgi:hypothetical protein
MGKPISIRLKDAERAELEAQAHERGIGVSTLAHDMLREMLLRARYARIREASAKIGERVATSAEARAFYDDWGTPSAKID